MKYFIKTFGCQQNVADSERISSFYESRGYTPADKIEDADLVVINTCMVRKSAENRVYGLAKNLKQIKDQGKPNLKIVITGCMVGVALRNKDFNRRMREIMPYVDRFLPIDEIGFEYHPKRNDDKHAWVIISNGCNNYCSYCIVPYSRGPEVSRPIQDILDEVNDLAQKGYTKITLLGQNVNSYGADLIKKQSKKDYYVLDDGTKIKTTMVKHLGQMRIPTLFPYLLESVAKVKGLENINFISSNPWDFSDELIDVIARNKNITREIHLPVQSGDNEILKKMNRWYTREEYLDLISRIRQKVEGVKFTTDIIVGFPGETDEQFNNTYDLVKQVGFEKLYIAMYSPRQGSLSAKKYKDDVPHKVKKERFWKLNSLMGFER